MEEANNDNIDFYALTAHGFETRDFIRLKANEYVLLFNSPGKDLNSSEELNYSYWSNILQPPPPVPMQLDTESETREIYASLIRSLLSEFPLLEPKKDFAIYTGDKQDNAIFKNMGYFLNAVPNFILNFIDKTKPFNYRTGMFNVPSSVFATLNKQEYVLDPKIIQMNPNILMMLLTTNYLYTDRDGTKYNSENIKVYPPPQYQDEPNIALNYIIENIRSQSDGGFILIVQTCRSGLCLPLKRFGIPLDYYILNLDIQNKLQKFQEKYEMYLNLDFVDDVKYKIINKFKELITFYIKRNKKRTLSQEEMMKFYKINVLDPLQTIQDIANIKKNML